VRHCAQLHKRAPELQKDKLQEAVAILDRVAADAAAKTFIEKFLMLQQAAHF
jgi:hypothetical protein